MPKATIDYSTTIFYKIVCNDPAITDAYIGHTTNFVQRKYAHKQGCKCKMLPKHDTKLYETIRKHGGWENWTMEIIDTRTCKDSNDVKIAACEYITLYNATLNGSDQLPAHYERHPSPPSSAQNPPSFTCETCEFICSKNVDWQRHITTAKHTKKVYALKQRETNFTPHVCSSCNNHFTSRTSLWRHSKTCTQPSIDSPVVETINANTILEILKQNQTFRDLMVEQSAQLHESHRKMQEAQQQMQQAQHENMALQRQLLSAVNDGKLINNTIHHNTTTNHHNNQKFNLNFFLNTTCKDAINLSDFIETIEVQMNELENIGHNGYVAGMTDIILSRIKDLDVSKRPVHCTDLKREIMYIKDQNEWNKDTAEKSYLRKAISMVSKKNYGKTMEWRERNPECLEIGSPKYDFCFKMMRNVLGDFEDIQVKMDNKIIKSLAKEVVLDRQLE